METDSSLDCFTASEHDISQEYAPAYMDSFGQIAFEPKDESDDQTPNTCHLIFKLFYCKKKKYTNAVFVFCTAHM